MEKKNQQKYEHIKKVEYDIENIKSKLKVCIEKDEYNEKINQLAKNLQLNLEDINKDINKYMVQHLNNLFDSEGRNRKKDIEKLRGQL